MKTSISASVQAKSGRLYIVLCYKEDGRWKHQWKKTELAAKNQKRKAERMKERIQQEFREDAEEEARRESWGIDYSVQDMVFADYLLMWKQRKSMSVALGTQQGYEMILRYAEPYFRRLEKQTKQITPMMIEGYYDFLLHKKPHPLSANTVRKHAVLLKSAFNDAIKDGQLRYNPAKRAKEPKKIPYNANTYSAEEIIALLAEMEGHSLEDVVWIAVLYGLRRSEICGLRWQDVDFEQNVLYVRHKIMQARVNGQRVIEKSNALKTQSSRRSYPLHPEIKKRLLKRREEREKYQELFGDGYDRQNEEYIFVEPDGSLLQPDRITNRFRSFMKYHKQLPRIRFHDLRHSCATLLLHQGFSLREIQDYMGHATIITTTQYAHVDSYGKRKALAAIGDSLLPADVKEKGVS